MIMMYIIKQNKNEKWIIIKKGAKRATRIFDTKLEAVMYAKEHFPGNYEVEEPIAVKIVRRHPKRVFIVLLVLLLLLLIGVAALYFTGNLDRFIPKDNTKDTPNETPDSKTEGYTENVIYDDFQIHFLELGNKYAGDCTYIKAGDTDILIDAGSRKDSADDIKTYVDQYCTDGKLEYVIATHAHQDHIAGFVGTGSGVNRTGILYQYQVDTIIDFALSDATTQIYQDYLTARERLLADGTKHYTAAECFTNSNGASATYSLGEGMSFTILYNYYYFNSAKNTEGEENNYSVCTLFSYQQHNFLLTGDLEQEGEEKLAEYYTAHEGLGKVELFKGGHHGSATSSNECLLEIIQPEICCVCCCAGSTEYTANYNTIFPTQAFITRIAKYTDRVYVTSLLNEETKQFEAMNGNITISSNGVGIGLFATNHLTKLKDTAWFNAIIYVDADDKISSGKGKEDFFTQNTVGVRQVKRRIWPTVG